MKSLLLIFLSFTTFSQANLPENLKQEVEEFMKNREQMYNQIIQDNSVFDDNAKALIKKLMNSNAISGFEETHGKLKFSWNENILWIFNLSNEDEIQINVTGIEVKIQGKHFEKIKDKNVERNIRQSITIPRSVKFKTHKIEFLKPNFKISFN